MTISRRLLLSNFAILTLLGCNVGFHYWSDGKRAAAFEELHHAISRQALISSVSEKLNDYQKQIMLLSQMPTGDQSHGAPPGDVAQFERMLHVVGDQVKQLVSLADPAGREKLEKFAAVYRELSASWSIFYRTFGRDQTTAITEVVTHIEPLGLQATEILLPGLKEDERLRVQTASERFYMVSSTVNTVTVAIFLISGLLIGLVAFLVSRRITGGLNALMVGAEMLGEGNLNYRIPVPDSTPGIDSGDELVDLASSFNGMAQRLDSTHTELERRQQKLEVLREAAETANRAKSQFLANMSHELRTPMNAIIGYSEMIIDEAADLGLQNSIGDLQKIQASGKHLLALISDILDLSKIEAGRMELYPETFDVQEMIRDLTSTIQPLVDKNSNSLAIEFASDVGSMHGDLTKVRQMMLNLLSNACKFTQSGVVRIKVRPEMVDRRRWVIFQVEDSGIGMEQDRVSKVFESFTQADASTTRKYGGTGLGLTITRKFCEMMGGDISVESTVGVGTTFTMRLPGETGTPDTLQALARAVSLSEPGGTDIQEDTRPVLQGTGSVLVIDDDPAAQGLMNAYLTRAGYSVTIASGGTEGLDLARKLRPDIITLDVMMPRVDGWNVLASLKGDAGLAGIPVIVISMVENQTMAYSLGAARYLAKPVNRDRLISVLQEYAGAPRQPA